MQFYTSKQLVASADFLPFTDNEKLTYKALMQHVNARYACCTVLYSTLAEKSGLSLSTVKRHVKTFVASGIIKLKHNYYLSKRTNERRQSANTYQVDREKLLEWVDYHLSQQGKTRYSKIQWKAICHKIKQLSLSSIMTFSGDTVLKGTVKVKQNNKSIDTKDDKSSPEAQTTYTESGQNHINQLKMLFKRK